MNVSEQAQQAPAQQRVRALLLWVIVREKALDKSAQRPPELLQDLRVAFFQRRGNAVTAPTA